MQQEHCDTAQIHFQRDQLLSISNVFGEPIVTDGGELVMERR